MVQHFLSKRGKPAGAIFLSGSGSNAEQLLEYISENDASWNATVLVTDRPKTSRARDIAKKFNLPLIELGIKNFYTERGESRVSLMTERGREIREEWTNALRELLKPYSIDFGILAGFVPLSNITSDFPCLNIHPGDLTIEENGQRLLVGLHSIPIETAILKGHSSLRSSTIIAQTYTAKGGEMDSGPLLGISSAVEIDLMGNSIEELQKVATARPEHAPIGGYGDLLEEIAVHNQELLKEGGDWIVFPPAVNDFAAGKFGYDGDKLFYNIDGDWKEIKTVIYDGKKREPIFI